MALILPYAGKAPRIHATAFVAPTAVIVGDVEIGAESSIWFGAVLRGDEAEHGIVIGARTSVQDNCVVHVSARGPTIVGDDCTIGHGAAFESCEIRRGALVGMNAVLLHGVVVGEEALVAAGSVVPAGLQIPPRTLVAGVPARVRKGLEGEAAEWIGSSAAHYVARARSYLEQGIGRPDGSAAAARQDRAHEPGYGRDGGEF